MVCASEWQVEDKSEFLRLVLADEAPILDLFQGLKFLFAINRLKDSSSRRLEHKKLTQKLSQCLSTNFQCAIQI